MQGPLIAFVGLVIGLFNSYLFYWLQSTYNIIPLPLESYYMNAAPVEPHLTDVVLVSLVTFVLAFLASIIPSDFAAKIQPLKIIAFGKA